MIKMEIEEITIRKVLSKERREKRTSSVQGNPGPRSPVYSPAHVTCRRPIFKQKDSKILIYF